MVGVPWHPGVSLSKQSIANLMLIVIMPSTAGTATITLTSTLDGRQTACPGVVVTYTCTVLRTGSAGWGVPPSMRLINYFPSSPVGRRDIGDFQVALTNRFPDPNNARIADLTITLTFTATLARNGTVVQCRGDDPSERMNQTLNVASEQCRDFHYIESACVPHNCFWCL